MLCIDNTYTDAYFNMAAEEYLLKNFRDNIFMVYQDEPSVIVGKHQDVRAEVNLDFTTKQELKVVRRFSGGGTVFHDLGNLNLTFIENNNTLDFDKFTNEMIGLLSAFGIHAQSDCRRALYVDGLKISGSAQSVRKNRIMYHATLLFSSDLESLQSSLQVDIAEFPVTESKRLNVRSVKSPVTNIVNYLDKPLNIETFRKLVIDYFVNRDADNEIYNFSDKDISAITTLVSDKYATSDWTYNAVYSLK